MKNNSRIKNSAFELNEDLDYLADAGQEKLTFNPQELEELNTRIRSSGKLSPPPSGIFIFFMAIMIFITTFFFLNPLRPSPPKKNESIKFSSTGPIYKSVEYQKKLPRTQTEAPILQYKKEHFLVAQTERPTENKIKTNEASENIEPIQILSIGKDSSSQAMQTNEYNPNVYEIMGYKITNYHLYYFKPKNSLLETPVEETETQSSDEWFEPEHASSAVKTLKEALSALRKTQYAEALQQFNILLNLNPDDENAIFYSGLCCYFNKKYPAAESYFQKTESVPNSVFEEEAKYYRATSLHYSGKPSLAKVLFTEIVKENKFYATRAAEFLR